MFDSVLPLISWDLAQARVTLQRLATEQSLPGPVISRPREVDQVLGLVEKSRIQMTSHLRDENVCFGAALSRLAELVPLSPEETVAAVGPPSSRIGDPEALAEINQTLRSILSLIITTAASSNPETAPTVNRLSAGALRAGLVSRPW